MIAGPTRDALEVLSSDQNGAKHQRPQSSIPRVIQSLMDRHLVPSTICDIAHQETLLRQDMDQLKDILGDTWKAWWTAYACVRRSVLTFYDQTLNSIEAPRLYVVTPLSIRHAYHLNPGSDHPFFGDEFGFDLDSIPYGESRIQLDCRQSSQLHRWFTQDWLNYACLLFAFVGKQPLIILRKEHSGAYPKGKLQAFLVIET